MSNIKEQIYIERLKQSPDSVKDYVYGLVQNPYFSLYIEKYRNSILDKESVIDALKNELSLLLLKIETVDSVIEKVVNLLDIKPFEAEDMITTLLSTCLPKDLQYAVEESISIKQNNTLYKDTGMSKNGKAIEDNSSISHIDVLSEIENPTPSISTTKTFDNKSTGTTASSTQNNSTNTQTTSSNHPAQPHQIGLGGFGNTSSTPANPAQNIATKLGQNLSTPTTSIPKEVYVSKKPDPYHEPVL